MLPLSYAIRNLARDPSRFIQSLLGTALVVTLVSGADALNRGMKETLKASGSPKNIMLLGAGSEESIQRSEVSEQAAGIAEASLQGVAEVLGRRSISPEIVHMAFLDVSEEKRVRGMVRGVSPQALMTHQSVRVMEGRFPGPGEIMPGRMAWKRLGLSQEELAVGRELFFDGALLRISGIFAAPGTVMESEVWMNINDLRTLAQRETLSTVVVRLDEGEKADVELFTRQRLDLELSAVSEEQYYEKLSRFYAPIRAMTWVTALLIATAAVFGGLNTLYAAFASRVRETATLQAIGFRRSAILISLLQESMLMAMIGTLAGSLVSSLLFAERIIYFGAGAFRLNLGPESLFAGLAAGVILGMIGVIPPAIRCLKPPLPQALRD